MLYVNDEPEGKFLYTETIKLYCVVKKKKKKKGCASHKSTNRSVPSKASEASTRSSFFFFFLSLFFFFFLSLSLSHLQESSLCSQPIRGNIRRTRFAKRKFVQLRTSYVGLGSTNNPNYVREANIRPVKNGER